MHHLGEGHQLLTRVGPLGQISDRALLDPGGGQRAAAGIARIPAALAIVQHAPHRILDQRAVGVDRLVKRRHIDARDLRQGNEQVTSIAVAELGKDCGDLADDFFPVAQHDGIDEVGDRLGVVGAVAADHHQRLTGDTVCRSQRQVSQIDEVDQVRVGQLGREVEGQHVEGGRRLVMLDREQRDPLGSHYGFEVAPWGIPTVGTTVGPLIDDLVQDLQALVGQADLVGVRVQEHPADERSIRWFAIGAVLAADVARWLLDLGQMRFDQRPNGWPGGQHRAPTLPDQPVSARPVGVQVGEPRWRCTAMLWTSPKAANVVSNELPPALTNGSGTPVMGISRTVMATF